MNKKRVIIIIVSILLIISILALVIYTNTMFLNIKEEKTIDIVNTISEKIIDKSKDITENVVENIKNQNIILAENTISTQISQENTEQNETQTNSSIVSSNSSSQTSSINSNKSTTADQSQQNTKQEIPTTTKTEPSKQETAYWCVDGGTHHIAGDGANEHGYYSSWDSAYQAFESYTKDWTSCQYKINQCGCGLYYFWAIQ